MFNVMFMVINKHESYSRDCSTVIYLVPNQNDFFNICIYYIISVAYVKNRFGSQQLFKLFLK